MTASRPAPLPVPWQGAHSFRFTGVDLLDIDVAAAASDIEAAVAARRPCGIHLCNAYTLALAAKDAGYRSCLQQEFAVNLPDGTPVSWFYRLASGARARGPVRGPGLMAATLARPGLRHFLLGGSEDVLADLEASIARDFPAANLVGRLAPPFREPTLDDLRQWAGLIAAAEAEVVWVGLGTPRQDAVVADLAARTGVVLIGVGAAFDFLSGHKPQAPALLHNTGLEWLHRLATEPRRLWRRYLFGNSRFVAQALRELPTARRTLRSGRSAGA